MLSLVVEGLTKLGQKADQKSNSLIYYVIAKYIRKKARLMKLIQTLILICFSIAVKAQDISFTLTHTSEKKWIGVEKTSTLNGMKSTNLVFHTNHKADIIPVNSHKKTVTTTWQLISGATTHDDNIVIRIGDIEYTVVFSKTSNGADFITLSWVKNDRVMSRAYYSE